MRKSDFGVRRFPQFILLLNFCLMGLPVHGNQPNDWGIKAGVSISDQSYHYKTMQMERHFKNYTGLNIDLFGNTIQSDHLSIAGQLSYIQKGCIEELSSTFVDPSSPQGYVTGEKRDFINRIDYFSIAVLGKINVGSHLVKPYAFIGPRYDIPIKTKSISSSIYDHLKNNWGFSAGFGCEFRFLWPDRMLVEFQYSPDLSEIHRTEFLSIRKSSYEVKLGIVF